MQPFVLRTVYKGDEPLDPHSGGYGAGRVDIGHKVC